MPFLPHLPDQKGLADTRLRFLENFAAKYPSLSTSVEGEISNLPALAALTEAAALAFISDQTKRGRQIIARVLTSADTSSDAGWLVRQSVLSAVVRAGELTLGGEGPKLVLYGRTIGSKWMASAPTMQSTAGAILAASLAAPDPRNRLEVLEGSPRVSDNERLAQMTITIAPESAVLPLFGMTRDHHGKLRIAEVSRSEIDLAYSSFLSLHERYAAHLRLAMADHYRWGQMRCRAPLLDWPLLLLHLAISRNTHYQREIPRDAGFQGQLFSFLQRLAREIDGGDDDGRGYSDYGSGGSGPRSPSYQTLQQRSRYQTY